MSFGVFYIGGRLSLGVIVEFKGMVRSACWVVVCGCWFWLVFGYFRGLGFNELVNIGMGVGRECFFDIGLRR